MVVRTTEKALLVDSGKERFWVPRSVVVSEGDIKSWSKYGDFGVLCVRRFWIENR